MNNFDDIFEQTSAKTEPPKPEEKKEKAPKAWWQRREEKQRREAYGTLDQKFHAFAEGKGDMEAYLDLQSRFPFHSARNVLLIGDQCPQAQRVNSYKGWEEQGISVLEEEKRLPIIILEPGKAYRRDDGSVGQNFYAKEVYDISQTSAREEAAPQIPHDERSLLKALLNSSPVPVRAAEALPDNGRGAMFSSEEQAILVKKGMNAQDIFQSVSLEAANVQLAKSNPEYSRESEGYKAFAISYMLCRRYGIDAQNYQVSRLNTVFQGKDAKEEIPATLTQIRDSFKELNGRMARSLGLSRSSKPKEQER